MFFRNYRFEQATSQIIAMVSPCSWDKLSFVQPMRSLNEITQDSHTVSPYALLIFFLFQCPMLSHCRSTLQAVSSPDIIFLYSILDQLYVIQSSAQQSLFSILQQAMHPSPSSPRTPLLYSFC